MSEIKVYKMDEYNWVATKWNLEDTLKWYEDLEEIDDKFTKEDIKNIQECNLETDGMWWEATEKDIEKLGDKEELCFNPNELTFGDIKYINFEVCKYISLRQALEYDGDFSEPYIIASTEW